MNKKLKQFVIFLGDIICLYFSLYLALRLRYRGTFDLDIFKKHFLPFTIIYCIWLIVFYVIDLYDLKNIKKGQEFLKKLFTAIVINAIIAIVFFYFIPYFGVSPKTNLFLTLIFFSILFILWRLAYSRFIIPIGPINNVLLIGLDDLSKELSQKIIDAPSLGYRLKAIIEPENPDIPSIWDGVKFSQDIKELKKIIKEEQINTIIVNEKLYQKTALSLYNFLLLGVDVFNISSFWEAVFQKIPISATNKIWFLENFHGIQKTNYENIKRGLDILFSVVLGLISLLFYPFIIAGIKLTSSGPIFYKQKRVGKEGKLFTLIKFRTMVTNAEINGAQWAKKDDKRTTKIGKFLRKTRLDEIPQIWNIFIGKMSFIGPRPERPELIQKIIEQVPYYQLRHYIKPGLSGWAQINYPYGSSIKDTEEKLGYDLYYLKNRSFFLDLSISLKTIAIVLSRKGQ